jgi:hypothetical protein
MPPVIPVPDQAIDPFAGGTVNALQSRHSNSTPEANAVKNACPETRSCSAKAKAAAATGPLGWTTACSWVSSKL